MATEAQIRAALAAIEAAAAAHPDWVAFGVWAQKARAIYDASRLEWRAQGPAIDVQLQEDNYGLELSPALLSIVAARQV